jgi:FlaA1/EpsC-like NDP-sugar epimerase
VTGLRPGEKLHEKLYFDSERPESTPHAGISRAAWDPDVRASPWNPEWLEMLQRAALAQNDVAVRRALTDSIHAVEMAPRASLEGARSSRG